MWSSTRLLSKADGKMSFLSDSDQVDTIISGQCSRSYICSLCHICFVSPVSLAEHYVSSRHERNVQSPEPQEQNDGICLSSFLKAHMKEDPIVGLEYVMEMKKDSAYTYSCRLCKQVNTNLPTIVQHIVNSLHTERYIDKHFKYLLSPYRDRDRRGRKRPDYVRVLRNAAVMIVEQQGSKEIQVVLLESDGKTSEDPPPSKPESDGEAQEAPEDLPPSKSESDGEAQEAPDDPPPSKSESDGKRNEAFKDPPPSKLEHDGKMRQASKDTRPPKPESDGKTQGASKDIPPSKYRSYGKLRDTIMDTPPSKPESGNISHSKLRPLPYRERRKKYSYRHRYHYNKVFRKSNSNDPSLAKRSRRSPGSDQDVFPSTSQISKHGSSHYNKSHAVTMDCTATQELEFRTNDEFFGYFANFVISDNKDVHFIRTITQNCIKALKCFLEEEAERQKTGHQPSLADTSRTAREIPGTLKSCLSDSKTTLLKDNSNPPSDFIPKNEATDVFFNAIKDMDESEVVSVLQKLAATNPKFQGLDIPTVIRFLKDSGKFKKP